MLTTAMSSMSIAVATQTTARVQRFVVMPPASPTAPGQGRRLSCETPVRGTVRGGAGSTTPTCSPRRRPRRATSSAGRSTTSVRSAHADAVPARLEAGDDLRQRAVTGRDQARLPRVDGDPDPPAQRLGRGQGRAARVGAHERARRRPRSGSARAGRTLPPSRRTTKASAGRSRSSRRRAELAQAALDDDAEAPGQRRRVLGVVGHEQRREPEPGQHVLQLAADDGAGLGVERRERLVEQQHAGVARQRPGQRDALALAAGQRARALVGQVVDAHPRQQLGRPARAPPKPTFWATVRCGNSASSCGT